MAITGVQLIYRLKDTVRLLIDYRTGSPPPDTLNFYWSSTELGAYTLFASGIINEPSTTPSVRGKIIFEFKPSTITNPTNWDNLQTNYIKMSTVTSGVESALEGPMPIPTKDENIYPTEKVVAFGFYEDDQKFIPLAVDDEGKLKTV